MLAGLRSLFEGPPAPVTVDLHGTPRKRPIRRKPVQVTYGSWMLPIDASGELNEDEFLMLSAIDLDE